MGAFESGQSFLAGVLAKLPEAVRAQVKAEFDKPEAKDALVLLGDGTLARSDYSKQMDELRTKQEELDDLSEQNQVWWREHQLAIQEYTKIKPEYDAWKAGNPNPNPNPNPPPEPVKAGMTKDEIDAYLSEREKGHVAVLGLTATLTARHQQMFGEAPDMTQVVSTAVQKRMTLQDAYDSIYGERVQAKHKEAEEKRFNDEVQKRLAEERRKLPTMQPYPIRDGDSPLDALQATDRKPTDYTVDSAAAEYARLQDVRNGQPA